MLKCICWCSIISSCILLALLFVICHDLLQTKGELSAERKDKLEAAQQSFQRLLQNTQALAVCFPLSYYITF